MVKISSGTGSKLIGVAAALLLAVLSGGCAKQETVLTAQIDTHAQATDQADIPEVIVTASRESGTGAATTRHQ